METIDEEFLAAAHRLHRPARRRPNKPFFVWFNTTRMHNFTHVRAGPPEAGAGRVRRRHDRARRADRHALDYLDESGSPTTRSSSTRPTTARWSASGRMPARRRSAARRTPTGRAAGACPAMIRWPGDVKPGTVINDIVAGEDWLPTLLAAAGCPASRRSCWPATRPATRPTRSTSTATTRPRCFAGKGTGPAQGVLLLQRRRRSAGRALRPLEDPLHGAERHRHDVWRKPFETLRAPIFFDLRSDPTERGQERHGLQRLVVSPRLLRRSDAADRRRASSRASRRSRLASSPGASPSTRRSRR